MKIKNVAVSFLLVIAMLFGYAGFSVAAVGGNVAGGRNKIAEITPVYAADPTEFNAIPSQVLDWVASQDPAGRTPIETVFNGIKSVGSVVQSVTSIYNGVMSILKFFGVVSDPEAVFRAKVLDMLDKINSKLDAIDSKINNMSQTLIKEFAKIGMEFAAATVKSDTLLVQNFNNNVANKMKDFISQYNTTVVGKYKTWFDQTDCGDVTLKLTFANKSEKEVVVTGEKIRAAKESLRLSWSFDRCEENVRKIFEKIFDELLSSGESAEFSAWLNDEKPWADLKAEEKNAKKVSFSKNAYDVLGGVFLQELATSGQGSEEPYAGKIKNAFENYCNALIGEASPLLAQYEIFEKTYCFQGDADYTETNNGVTRTGNHFEDRYCSYSLLLSVYGSYAVTVAEASGTVSTAEIKKQWSDTQEKLKEMYDAHYHKNADGTPIATWCYLLGQPVVYKTVNLSSTSSVTHQRWENNFGMDYECYEGFKSTPWQINADAGKIVGSKEMSQMFSLYGVLNGADGNFQTYLSNMLGKNITDKNLMTSFNGTFTFDLNAQIPMWVRNPSLGNYFEDYEQKKDWKYVHNGYPSKIENQYFVLHDYAQGDVFDLASGGFGVNQRLMSRAIYGEHHGKWMKDEFALLWQAQDYNGNWTNFDSTRSSYISRSTSYLGNDHTRYVDSMNITVQYGILTTENAYQPKTSARYAGVRVLKDVPSLTAINNYVKSVNAKAPKDEQMPLYYSKENDIGQAKTEEERLSYYLDDSYGDLLYCIWFAEKEYYNGDKAHDDAIYDRFAAFVQDEKNLKKMVDEYLAASKRLAANKIASKGEADIELSKEQREKLFDAFFRKYTKDCFVVSTFDDLPETGEAGTVYLVKNDLKYYAFQDGKYVETSAEEIGISPLPDKDAFRMYYTIKCGMSYELVMDENGNISCKPNLLFDIVPYISWNDGKDVLKVDNSVLKEAEIKVKIKVPVLDPVPEGSEAVVAHYQDLESEKPYEYFKGVVQTENGGKFIEVEVSSFSPFDVLEQTVTAGKMPVWAIVCISVIGAAILGGAVFFILRSRKNKAKKD